MKKNLWNVIMVVAIVAVLISGIMIVGSVRGVDATGTVAAPSTAVQPATATATATATAQDKLGSVNIQRSGIAYSLTEGSVLRDGDIIETLGGSSITLHLGDSSVRLGQNSEIALAVGAEDSTVALERGEVFVAASGGLRLAAMNSELATDSSVLVATAHTGSAAIYLLQGTATLDGATTTAGQSVSILTDGVQTDTLAIQSLNKFAIESIGRLDGAVPLCFTPAQLEELVAQRDAEMLEAAQARALEQQKQTADEQRIAAQRSENKNALAAATAAASSAAAAADNDRYSDSDEGDSGGGGSGGGGGGKLSCSIEIRCDNILENMDSLVEGKDQYVPASGKILSSRTITFSEGDTVFDLLRSACRQNDIQLEYSHSPIYDSYYIEGINNLYEFDCGGQSGWMYKVNGWFPNYGSSAYTLQDGDTVVWGYVCSGYEGGF